jgi:hypothetical protein
LPSSDLLDEHLDDFGRGGRKLAGINVRRRAVDGEEIAFLEGRPLTVMVLAA